MKCMAWAWCLCLSACGGSTSSTSNTSATSGTCAAVAGSQWLTGQVSAVLDGDTLVLNTGSHSEHIRLQGLDAPELAQAEGPEARQALSLHTLHQTAQVAYTQHDRYGRILGQVFTSDCKDLNLQMLQQGLAWFYKAYACDLDPARRSLYALAESQAHAQRLGLWQQAQPVAPWIYRNGEDPPTPICTD